MPDAKIFMERRVYPRIKVDIPVHYRLLEDKGEVEKVLEEHRSEKNAHAMDLSLGGMQIAADQPLKEGDVLKFEITLPGLSETLQALAEVVWSNGKTGGLHFLKVSDEDLAVLKAFLHRATKSR